MAIYDISEKVKIGTVMDHGRTCTFLCNIFVWSRLETRSNQAKWTFYFQRCYLNTFHCQLKTNNDRPVEVGIGYVPNIYEMRYLRDNLHVQFRFVYVICVTRRAHPALNGTEHICAWMTEHVPMADFKYLLQYSPYGIEKDYYRNETRIVCAGFCRSASTECNRYSWR